VTSKALAGFLFLA